MPDTPYRQFLDRIADGLFLHDGQGRLLEVNQQACASLGYPLTELLQVRMTRIIADLPGQALLAMWQDMPQDTVVTASCRLARRDGSSFPAELHICCQSVSGQRRFFTLARDISAREQHDEQIRQLHAQLEQRVREYANLWQDSTRLLASVMRETPDLVFVKDLQGRYTFVNPTAARLAQRVHVGAAEEIGLHIHLLDVEFTGLDLLVHPLVAGVEAAGMATHSNQSR